MGHCFGSSDATGQSTTGSRRRCGGASFDPPGAWSRARARQPNGVKASDAKQLGMYFDRTSGFFVGRHRCRREDMKTQSKVGFCPKLFIGLPFQTFSARARPWPPPLRRPSQSMRRADVMTRWDFNERFCSFLFLVVRPVAPSSFLLL